MFRVTRSIDYIGYNPPIDMSRDIIDVIDGIKIWAYRRVNYYNKLGTFKWFNDKYTAFRDRWSGDYAIAGIYSFKIVTGCDSSWFSTCLAY